MTRDVPPEWAELLAILAGSSWRRLVMLGATDMGKSTFCHLLCEHLARQGGYVDLLDSDLGQKMVGPPACVTMARMTADGGPELLKIRFVGEVSPAANIAGVVAATARLASAADGTSLIVNTSGLVAGPGIPLKRWKLDALDPDHVVGIGIGDELDPLVAGLPTDRVHRVCRSPAARRKSPSLRERNRRASLLTALGSCRRTFVPDLVVEDLHRSPPAPDALRLCALADSAGEDRALGLVRWSDYLRRKEVWTGSLDFQPHRMRLGMTLEEFGDVPGPFRRDQA